MLPELACASRTTDVDLTHVPALASRYVGPEVGDGVLDPLALCTRLLIVRQTSILTRDISYLWRHGGRSGQEGTKPQAERSWTEMEDKSPLLTTSPRTRLALFTTQTCCRSSSLGRTGGGGQSIGLCSHEYRKHVLLWDAFIAQPEHFVGGGDIAGASGAGERRMTSGR